MGNKQSQTKSNSDLPFFSKSEDDYNPLSEQQSSYKCSMKTRIMGYAVCCGVGWLISILSIVGLLIHHNTTQFAILYSVGQITNLTGTCFLATPKKQYDKMRKSSRLIYSICYIVTIILTLVLGLALPENLLFLVFISLILEIVAYFFYTLSYIPGGRKVLKKICRKMIE